MTNIKRIGFKTNKNEIFKNYGAMSKVYSFQFNNIINMKFTLKILLNYYSNVTIDIKNNFEKEYKILLNEDRLPKHDNIIKIYKEFIDDVPENLPDWDSEEYIKKKSLFVIMPYYKHNLSQIISKNSKSNIDYNFLPLYQGNFNK
jgi:hypothetical protein